MQPEAKLYRPEEAANMLGISVRMLAYLRRTGRIKGIEVAKNVTVYTKEQIDSANLSKRKPGPKTGRTEDLENVA